MSDITTRMITSECKKFNNDLIIKNYNENFTQNVINNSVINSNSLLYKIYLEITNKKTSFLKETLDENHKVIDNVAKYHSLKKCNIGEIIEIPINISSLFDDTKSYYRYGVSFNDSFIASILIIFDKLYMTLSNNIQNNYIKNLKKKLAYDLEEKNYYKLFNFKPHIIKKTDFTKMSNSGEIKLLIAGFAIDFPFILLCKSML